MKRTRPAKKKATQRELLLMLAIHCRNMELLLSLSRDLEPHVAQQGFVGYYV